MEKQLTELIELAKQISADGMEEIVKQLREIKAKIAVRESIKIPPCPHCGSKSIYRYGKKCGKQRYQCRSCKKTYVPTTNTVMYRSQSGKTAWNQVVEDTINGVSIDKTAMSLKLTHRTVFAMRHKILAALDNDETNNPTVISGVCEADETFVLDSLKGSKIPDDYGRPARKHGAVAQSRGISNEHICVCTAISRNGGGIARSVNRATPSSDDIAAVFGPRVNRQTLILCDGNTSYNVLEKNGICSIESLKVGKTSDSFYNINTNNGFHSFFKHRYRVARGFATKYLNRYNAILAKVFRGSSFLADEIFAKISNMNPGFTSSAELRSNFILSL